jgi:hypothetical protein
MMYGIAGWINVALIVMITSPFWLRALNTYLIKSKSKAFLKTLAFLRKLHKPLGGVLLVWALYHGYIAWGRLYPGVVFPPLHTGMLVWLACAVTAVLGLTFYLTKKKVFFKAHKIAALSILITLAVHRLFPYLIS